MSTRERDPPSVNMHMTFIKSKYKEKSENNWRSGGRFPAKDFFNASSILERFADYDFGSQEVNEIQLSSMREKDDDGYYKTISSVKF